MLANGQKDCRSALRVNADMHAVHIMYIQPGLRRSLVRRRRRLLHVHVRTVQYVLRFLDVL